MAKKVTCKSLGCKKPGMGPRFRHLCVDHREPSKAKAPSAEKSTKKRAGPTKYPMKISGRLLADYAVAAAAHGEAVAIQELAAFKVNTEKSNPKYTGLLRMLEVAAEAAATTHAAAREVAKVQAIIAEKFNIPIDEFSRDFLINDKTGVIRDKTAPVPK